MVGQVLDRVRRTIECYCLFGMGEPVVVGVSGGPDSVCLLHVLCRLGGEYGLSLHVAHLHHGLRGGDADADAAFVQSLAAEWGLPCTIERADVPALARKNRLAIEETARCARYAFLSRTAEALGASIVAVGHNADDQAETVLMHWIRGAGLAGLRGMLPSTALADYRLLGGQSSPEPRVALRLIRPLLEVPRVEIEAYCDYYELESRFDRSNLDKTYFRNWLRHEVLPLLASHNPRVGEVICRSARVIADDYALLRTLLEEYWKQIVLEEDVSGLVPDEREPSGGSRIVFDLKSWRALPTSLQRSTLREAIHRLRRSLRNINFLHVENALSVARDGTTGDRSTLPRGLMLVVGYERLTIAGAGAPQQLPDWPLLPPESAPVPVQIPGVTTLPGSRWVLKVGRLARSALPDGWATNDDPWRAVLDANAVGTALWLRPRRPGDRFQPLGMGGSTVKLADFLTNQKVRRTVRDRLPLLVGEAGIAWVCGQRVDERARVQDETEIGLALHFSPR